MRVHSAREMCCLAPWNSPILRRFALLHTLGQFVGSGYRFQASVGGIVELNSLSL